MVVFEIPNLIKTITDKRYDSFIEHIHYKYFNCGHVYYHLFHLLFIVSLFKK